MFWRSKRFTSTLTRRTSPQPSRLTARLRVEGLEDRAVPAFGANFYALNWFPSEQPSAITAGPDGTVWFTEINENVIGKITPSGTVTQYDYSSIAGFSAIGITVGPDGNVWFTLTVGDPAYSAPALVVRLTPAGEFTTFPLAADAGPAYITTGPDGNLWFTETNIDKIGRITPGGTVTEFTLPNPGTGTNARSPSWITAGADGNLWFGEINAAKIGRITPGGAITEYNLPNSQSQASFLVAGPDGNIWFSEHDQYGSPLAIVGKMTPSGAVTEYPASSGGFDALAVTPDGKIWHAYYGGLETIATDGTLTRYFSGDLNLRSGLFGTSPLAASPDGSLWLTANLDSSDTTDTTQQGSHILRIIPNGPAWTGQGSSVTADAGVPFYGIVGTFTGGSDLLPVGQRWVATVNWGDGTTSPPPGPTVNDMDSGVVTYANGQFAIWARHTYATTGTFTVTVTIASQAVDTGGGNNGNGGGGTAPGAPPQSPAVTQATVQISNDAFVERLYSDLLQRTPSDAEVKSWADQIDTGTATRDVVIKGFEKSIEYRTLVVQGLYRNLLHREGEPAGMAFWVAFLADHTVEQAQAAFIGSPEYYATRGGGTAAGFLAAEYQDLLGRPVDSTALATQASLLDQGKLRTNEALRVLSSPEAQGHRLADAYQDLLGRPASAPEIAGWLNMRPGGAGQAQVTLDLAGSTEYALRGSPTQAPPGGETD